MKGNAMKRISYMTVAALSFAAIDAMPMSYGETSHPAFDNAGWRTRRTNPAAESRSAAAEKESQNEQQPKVLCWIDNITYARDEKEKKITEISDVVKIGKSGRTVNLTGQTRTNSTGIGGGGGITVTSEAHGKIGTGGASGGVSSSVKAESHVKAHFSYETKQENSVKEENERFVTSESRAKDAAYLEGGVRNLTFDLHFHNRSKSSLRYEPGSELFVNIPSNGNNSSPFHRIHIPMTNEFDLPPGLERSFQISTAPLNKDYQSSLLNLRELGELDRIYAEFDGSFHLTEKGTGKPCYIDVNTCKVSADFGKDKKYECIVNCSGMTYSNVLEKASSKLAEDKRFSFSSGDGSLDKAFGRDFGKLAKDGEGVYCVFVEINREEFKDSLACGDLMKKPESAEKMKTLHFMRLGLEEIYNYRQKFKDSALAANCLAYVENCDSATDRDLFVCALLSKERGDYASFIGFLSRMKNLDKYLATAEDKALALRLIIASGKLDAFKNLESKLIWKDEFEDGNGNPARRTKLGYAAEVGAIDIVKWLLEGVPAHERPQVDGLVPDATEESIGDAGKTPLFWAAKKGNLEVCRYLYEKGANINRKFHEKDNAGNDNEYDELVEACYVTDKIRRYIQAEREIEEIRKSVLSKLEEKATLEKIRSWAEAGVPPRRLLRKDGPTLLSRAAELQDHNLVEFLTEHEPDERIKSLFQKVKANDAKAMNKLGVFYYQTYRSSHEDPFAKMFFYWSSRSADCGHWKGANNVAFCYKRGIGVDEDKDKSEEYKKKAKELIQKLEKQEDRK